LVFITEVGGSNLVSVPEFTIWSFFSSIQITFFLILMQKSSSLNAKKGEWLWQNCILQTCFFFFVERAREREREGEKTS
jgi:prolipoprotein diacylglyceryltransferase